MRSRLDIAEELLGMPIGAGGFVDCPGAANHTTKAGARDFRVILDGVPTGYCFHGSCSDAVETFNRELRSRIAKAEGRGQASEVFQAGVAPEPRTAAQKRPPIDLDAVARFTRGTPSIDGEWLAKRSPVDVDEVGSRKDEVGNQTLRFLEKLYLPNERVLIFTQEFSQGEFVFWNGSEPDGRPTGTYRLSQKRGVKAVPSALPRSGRNGVWFLVQPVSGQWSINANEAKGLSRSGSRPVRWSRRWEGEARAWRYFVLESDELPHEQWLQVLVNLPVPIAAAYTSGRRSVHALVKFEVGSKAEWDATRDCLRALVCPLGADAGAMSAVRLSRLPGCYREGRTRKDGSYERFAKPELQRLLYLNPEPDHVPIRLMPEVRG